MANSQRRKLTFNKANRAIVLLQGDQRQSELVTFFQVRQSVISRLFRRFQDTEFGEENLELGAHQ